jgi:adenylosuccinate synthase
MVLLRYSVRINGLNELALTKLDILSGIETIKLCSAYHYNNQVYQELPLGPDDIAQFEPVYEELPGWDTDLTGCRKWADLPSQTRAYIRRSEESCGVPVCLASVGPEREQVVEAP